MVQKLIDSIGQEINSMVYTLSMFRYYDEWIE